MLNNLVYLIVRIIYLDYHTSGPVHEKTYNFIVSIHSPATIGLQAKCHQTAFRWWANGGCFVMSRVKCLNIGMGN